MIKITPPRGDEHGYLVKLRNDNRDLFFDNRKITLKSHLEWYNNLTANDFFFIIKFRDGTPLGTISLYNITNKTGEYGRFVIEEKYRGNGYGKRAMRLLMAFAESCGLNYIYGDIFGFNVSAINLDIDLGFKYIKSFLDRYGNIIVRMGYDLLAS